MPIGESENSTSLMELLQSTFVLNCRGHSHAGFHRSAPKNSHITCENHINDHVFVSITNLGIIDRIVVLLIAHFASHRYLHPALLASLTTASCSVLELALEHMILIIIVSLELAIADLVVTLHPKVICSLFVADDALLQPIRRSGFR